MPFLTQASPHTAFVALALAVASASALAPDNVRGLISNLDNTWATSVRWGPEGLQGPAYGAFAEQMPVAGDVTRVDVTLRRGGAGPAYPFEGTVDVFVWRDEGGRPGAVLALSTQVVSGTTPRFPEVTTLSFPLLALGTTRPWAGARTTPHNPAAPVGVAGDGG